MWNVLCLFFFDCAVVVHKHKGAFVIWIFFASGSSIARTQVAATIIVRELDLGRRLLLASRDCKRIDELCAQGNFTAMVFLSGVVKPESSFPAVDCIVGGRSRRESCHP